ncbi:30S ribosomal protein S8 [Candidatus Falkowbacteria bacterium]|nr:MAG: 30S ribosomal protein S8 [Candidatus Falkowbacteria bacterium]
MMDPIADMLSRIRNAAAVQKAEIVLPMSKLKFNIAKLLEENGWVTKAEVIPHEGKDGFDELKIVLKYKPDGKPKIASLTRISKSSRRVYVGKDELPRVLNNLGIAILSTSQGLMTNREARKRNLGGEVICEIY